MADAQAPEDVQQISFAGFGGRGTLELFNTLDLQKVDVTDSSGKTTQEQSVRGLRQGLNNYPFKVNNVNKATFANSYHSTCLAAKVNATVGLGFLSDAERESGPQALNSSAVQGEQNLADQEALTAFLNPFYLPSQVDERMNEVCEYSWNDVMLSLGHDFYRSGNAYLEVARDPADPINGEIKAVWHLPWAETKAFVEDNQGRHWHWRHRNLDSGERVLARYGQKKQLLERSKTGNVELRSMGIAEDLDPKNVHEVIHIRNPMALHEIYGYPEWLAAASPMELIGALMQYKYDFFTNRGVPEYALIVTGGKVPKKNWDAIVASLNSHVGAGNSHKSWALNIENEGVTVTVEKLGLEGKSDEGIFKDKESLQADIVTAHRLPPLLGNIMISGKLGATNEFINSLLSFQLLTINSPQRIFQQTLGSTLGSKGAKLELEPNDFILRKVTDLIDVGKADTVSRMREELPEAKAKGRDIGEGLKD